MMSAILWIGNTEGMLEKGTEMKDMFDQLGYF